MAGSFWVTVLSTLRYLQQYLYLHPVTKKQITLKYCSIKKKIAQQPSTTSLQGCARGFKRTKGSVFTQVGRVIYMIYSLIPTHEINVLLQKWIDGRLCHLASSSSTWIIVGISWILTLPSIGSAVFLIIPCSCCESQSFQILSIGDQSHRIGNVLIRPVLISDAL